jgi:hypothetical protein
MCSVDTEVFGLVWVNKSSPHTFPDFNTKHVCRDFEQVRAWAKAHQIPHIAPDDYDEPPGPDTVILDFTP